MEGKKFKHKYLPYLTCVVVAATRKGYKVLETQVLGGRRKPKTKTAYYYSNIYRYGNKDIDRKRNTR